MFSICDALHVKSDFTKKLEGSVIFLQIVIKMTIMSGEATNLNALKQLITDKISNMMLLTQNKGL